MYRTNEEAAQAAVIDYVFYHGGARPAQQVEHDVNRVFDRLGLRTHVCSFARIFVEQFEAFYGRK